MLSRYTIILLACIAGCASRRTPSVVSPLVAGSVVAGYSVDTLGHVIPGSERIVAEAHSEFGDAVCEMLKDLRFNPLVLNGRKYSVRVLEQPFTFSLIR